MINVLQPLLTPDPACADIKLAGRVWSLVLALFAALAVSHVCGAAAGDAAAQAAGDGGESGMEVSVPYATNRRPMADDLEQGAYGGRRGPPGYGRCSVLFTPIPVINQIAPRVPFYLADETRDLRIERQTDMEAFWGQVQGEIARTASQSVVVFVHGYNYGFERHCSAAAELQRTLEGKAVVLMFSWPSNGRPTDYIPDQADVEWSVPFLARLLADLGDRLGPERVQVLAHSLGSRGVLFALERLKGERERRPLIGQLVLMAPDFDAQIFVERLPALLPLTTGITLYASSNDTPLKASRQLHDSPRLGEGGAFLTVAESMQTVDVSPVGRYQVLGHEYFLFHPRVAADLAVLLGEGRAARDRPGLRPARSNGLDYWELVGDKSKGDASNE
jgi:esterase/lipase superfamily enzyme